MARFSRHTDRGAFEEVVRRWDRRVLSFLAKTSGDLEAAEDLRQEVFIRVYRYGRGYDPKYAFPTWLFKIAANVLKTWQAKQGRRRDVDLGPDAIGAMVDPADGRLNPREEAARNESASMVRSAIARLRLEDRELLLYRFDLDMSYREISLIRDAPETTIKSQMYALIERLRGEFNHSEIIERT